MRRNSRGFSMIELLVAMTVIAIGLLAVAGLMPLGREVTTRSGHMTRAIEYAQQKMEKLRQLGWENFYHPDLDPGEHGPDTLGIFLLSWEVIANDPMEDMKRVTITVTSRTGPLSQPVELETFIGNRSKAPPPSGT